MSETLFVSDLHLEESRPAVTQQFLSFLDRQANHADALYILGDLFEVWLGDDDPSPLARRVIGSLRQLTEAGVPAYFIHGNRDFLIGDEFARQSGCRLLPEAGVIDLYGTATLVTHGDTLCTDDVRYQAFRRQVRSPSWQHEFLSLPRAERERMARHMREENTREKLQKSDEIMDVNQAAVEAAMRDYGAARLIHGHTHRPAIHEFSLDERPRQRLVLGAWGARGSIGRCSPTGCRLETY